MSDFSSQIQCSHTSLNPFFYNPTGNIKLKEEHLYKVWERQFLHNKETFNNEFITLTGKKVKILFCGHRNSDSGPDFKNAKILLNETLVLGDIELHLKSTDWYSHKHHINPEYNNTILHIVFSHNHKEIYTLSQDMNAIDIVEIKNLIINDRLQLSENQKYCRYFSTLDSDSLLYFLTKTGTEKFNEKVDRFENILKTTSLDQLFYQHLFESLGYSKNNKFLLAFAKKYDWIYFKNKYSKGMSYKDFTIELKELLDKHINEINLFRIRPCNTPQKRVLNISKFLYKCFETSISSEIFSIFSFIKEQYESQLSNDTNKSYKTILSIIKERISKKLFNSKIKFSLHTDLITFNIFLPIMSLYAKKTNNEILQRLCKNLVYAFYGLLENNVNKKIKIFMTDHQHTLVNKKAITQLGLLKIYNDYCFNHNCLQCVEKLNSYKTLHIH